MTAIEDVVAERRRQVEVETWTPSHDDRHTCGELAAAAACYATPARSRSPQLLEWLWPFDPVWWKEGDRRRELVKAGALIVAEIERMDRLQNLTPTT
jgi:hypothetical protein